MSITGYRSGKIIGCENDYLLVSAIGVKDQCKKCCRKYDDSDECSNSDKTCLTEGYYYIYTKKKFKSMYRTIDMDKLSRSCSDFCNYYGKNCYNVNKDICMIRLIEESSESTY